MRRGHPPKRESRFSTSHGTGDRLPPGFGPAFDLLLRSQARLATSDAFRRSLFREQSILLDRFLAGLGIVDPDAVETAHRQRALASILLRLRGHFGTLSPARRRSWLIVEDGVEPALRSGGVLLLGTHFGGGLLTPLALSRFGIPVLTIARLPKVARLRASLDHPCIEVCDLDSVPGYAAAATAVDRLRRGGVAFIGADFPSHRAVDNVEADVLGQARPISRGFAEIALSAGTRPIPVFSRVEESGRISTWVEAPLEAAGATRRDRAAGLVHGFAARMSETFRRHPGNVAPPVMRRFLERA